MKAGRLMLFDFDGGLEQESEADLDLARRKREVAVAVTDAPKGRVEVERGIYGLGHRVDSRTSDDVARVVHDRHVLVVENVESLAEKFDSVALTETDSLREAQVHVNGSLLAETVAPNHINSFSAVGAIDAGAQSRI